MEVKFENYPFSLLVRQEGFINSLGSSLLCLEFGNLYVFMNIVLSFEFVDFRPNFRKS